jgi:hypothetical protein
MGYLLHLLVALLGQGLAETGWKTGWDAPWLVLLALPLPHLLGWTGHRLFLRGRFRASAAVLRLLSGAAPALHILAVCAFGWMDALERWFGDAVSLAGWPRIGLLLALAPFVVYEVAAIDARARLIAPPGKERDAWRSFHARMLLSGLVPLAGYVLISTLVGANDRVRVEIEEVSLFSAAFAAVLLLVLAISLPWLLSNVWDTSPFPAGERRDLLLSIAERARFRARALLAWNTGDLMANAAIVASDEDEVVLFSVPCSRSSTGRAAAVFATRLEPRAVRPDLRLGRCLLPARGLHGEPALSLERLARGRARCFSRSSAGSGLRVRVPARARGGPLRLDLSATPRPSSARWRRSAAASATSRAGAISGTAERALPRAHRVNPAVGRASARDCASGAARASSCSSRPCSCRGGRSREPFPGSGCARTASGLRLALARDNRPGIDPELASLARRVGAAPGGRPRDIRARACGVLAGDVDASLGGRLGDLRRNSELAAISSTLTVSSAGRRRPRRARSSDPERLERGARRLQPDPREARPGRVLARGS